MMLKWLVVTLIAGVAMMLIGSSAASGAGKGGGAVVTFPDGNLAAAIRAAISKPTGDILASDLVGIGFTALTADNAGIGNLSGIEYCEDLTFLSLNGNSISDLTPLAPLTALSEIRLNDNNAANLGPLSGLTNLVVLRAKGNGITALPDLSGLDQLESLTLGGNLITNLSPLADLRALRTAGLAGNAVSVIEPGDLPPSVEALVLSGNGLTDISGLASVTSLVSLDLSDNAIVDLSSLTQNDGLGAGDTVDVTSNPLGMDSLCVIIPALDTWWVDVTFDGGCSAEGEGEGEGEGEEVPHGADQNGNGSFELAEVLRVVQFYNMDRYSCSPGSEDGYAPGPGDTTCAPHSGDYAPQNWVIDLSELLRLIQFFNGGGYYTCGQGEDGYCVADAPPPNVVYLMLDTLRANRIGAMRNGIPVAPFLESMAARGANFTHAVAPATWTRPSMAGYFTGLYPNTLLEGPDGNDHMLYSLHDGIVTIGEWFSGIGYDCWAVQTNGNASAFYGFDQGFAEGRYVQMNGFPAALVVDQALDTLPDWQEPFFSYVHFMDPHGTYSPPVEYQEFFGPQPETTASDEINLTVPGFSDYVQKLYGAWVNGTEPEPPLLSEGGREAMLYRYDAEIRYMDDEIERLVTTIEAAFPNTIVVVVSDHGEALEQRERLIGHGHTLYEEQANVPLIFMGPGIEAQEIDTAVETLGILPTLANLMGVPEHPQWQGKDCFAQAAQGGAVFCHSVSFYLTTPVFGEAVYRDALKLVDHSSLPSVRLFDLALDPDETVDVSPLHPIEAGELDALLTVHLDRVIPPGSDWPFNSMRRPPIITGNP